MQMNAAATQSGARASGTAAPVAGSPPQPRHLRAKYQPVTGRSLLTAWTISLGLHGFLLILMFKLAWLSAVPQRDEALPIALTDIAGDPTGDPVDFSSRPDLARSALDAPADAAQFEPRAYVDVQAATGTGRGGAGTGSGSGDGGEGVGGMTGGSGIDVVGIGTGGADFGNVGGRGGSGAPGPELFKSGGGKARGVTSVVYVVDRSGSMIDTFDRVKQELKTSIGKLQMSQKFHVVFFSAGDPLENPPKRLISARAGQKQEFFEFLDTVRPEGSTNPTQAMERAFQCQPEMIFFLTDGAFHKSLIERLRVLNRDHKVRIFTIAYVDPVGAELLETIARENGGEFKFVSDRELP